MEHLNFVINSTTAEKMAKTHGLNSVLQLLPLLLKPTQSLSRPPISGFAVAAIGLSSDGRVFLGVNVEFPNLPLHHSIHAEQFLVTNLSRYPHTTLKYLVISAYPCGHCRQFLQEIRGAAHILVYVPQTDHTDTNTIIPSVDCFKPLSYFLPHRFGPDDLLDKDVPLMMENHDNGLSLSLSIQSTRHYDSDVLAAALAAANRSYAPYSKCPSGIALVDKDGGIYKGSYMESAAYNPSLGPMQAAVIDYIATTAACKGRDEVGYESIIRAVLVEKGDAVVRQEETVRMFLKAVSPKCEFFVYHCKNSGSDSNGVV